jgi:hypothetical protein
METKVIEEKAREFAGLIANVLTPLNQNPKFIEKFRKIKRKYLINATNLNYAALVKIENGRVTVQSVANKPKSNLKRKITGWDSFISMNSQIFLALAMDKISKAKVGLKVLSGKVKLKGFRKLRTLLKLFEILK